MSNLSQLVDIQPAPGMRRRDLLDSIVRLMTAAALYPATAATLMAQHGAHGASTQKKYRPLATGKPAFFKGGEYKTLTRMVDLIIPQTSTPGAADAGVPRYIDIVAGDDAAIGMRLRSGLAELDARSKNFVGRSFIKASKADQVRVLEAMLPAGAVGNEFFESVKAMTLVGYYSSEIGLYEELHFVGNEALSAFPGCPHGGHSLDVPARNARAAVRDATREWPFPTSDNILGEDL